MRARADLQLRRRSTAAISLAFITLAGLGAGNRALAQSAEAEALFNDGSKLMASGKLAAACDAFEASNRVEPRAGTLIRLGECREQNQQLASAWSAYKDALTRVKDPRKREVASAKAAALEPRLSYLTVSVSDESRIDGLTLTRDGKAFDAMLWNRALPVDGGDYIIAGRAPGHEEWQTSAHVPVERAKVSVEVPKFKEMIKLIPTPAAPLAPPASVALPAAPPADHVPANGRFTTRRKVAIGVAGVGLAAGITGLILGASGKADQDDAFKRCPNPATPCDQADQSNALIKSSHRRSLEANVAFGVAAAGVIGAAVLWFTGAPGAESQKRVTVVPHTAPGELGVVVLGRF
jgi:hypothetical protein